MTEVIRELLCTSLMQASLEPSLLFIVALVNSVETFGRMVMKPDVVRLLWFSIAV